MAEDDPATNSAPSALPTLDITSSVGTNNANANTGSIVNSLLLRKTGAIFTDSANGLTNAGVIGSVSGGGLEQKIQELKAEKEAIVLESSAENQKCPALLNDQDSPLDFSVKRRFSSSGSYTDDSRGSSSSPSNTINDYNDQMSPRDVDFTNHHHHNNGNSNNSVPPPVVNGGGSMKMNGSSSRGDGNGYRSPFSNAGTPGIVKEEEKDNSYEHFGGVDDERKPIVVGHGGHDGIVPSPGSGVGGGALPPMMNGLGMFSRMPSGLLGNPTAINAYSQIMAAANPFMDACRNNTTGGGNKKNNRPFKAYPKEALQMPLGFFGLPGLANALHQQNAPGESLFNGMNSEELMNVYKQQLQMLRASDKQHKNVSSTPASSSSPPSSVVQGGTISPPTPISTTTPIISNQNNNSNITISDHHHHNGQQENHHQHPHHNNHQSTNGPPNGHHQHPLHLTMPTHPHQNQPLSPQYLKQPPLASPGGFVHSSPTSLHHNSTAGNGPSSPPHGGSPRHISPDHVRPNSGFGLNGPHPPSVNPINPINNSTNHKNHNINSSAASLSFQPPPLSMPPSSAAINAMSTLVSSTSPSFTSSASPHHHNSRKRPKSLPDEQKDEAYWERRRKNNDAAKRSRDARRAKEDEIALRAALLEQENLKLRVEVAALKTETARLRCMLYSG